MARWWVSPPLFSSGARDQLCTHAHNVSGAFKINSIRSFVETQCARCWLTCGARESEEGGDGMPPPTHTAPLPSPPMPYPALPCLPMPHAYPCITQPQNTACPTCRPPSRGIYAKQGLTSPPPHTHCCPAPPSPAPRLLFPPSPTQPCPAPSPPRPAPPSQTQPHSAPPPPSPAQPRASQPHPAPPPPTTRPFPA